MVLFFKIFLTEFIAEMGDKTQLMLIALNSKYKLKDIILGTAVAILVLNGLAVLAGGLVSEFIPDWVIKIVAALAFLYFAASTIAGDEDEEEEESSESLSEEEELEQFIDSIQPKDKRNPSDIVPREKSLTDDEKKLFTYFVKVPGMREQLISALCDVQMAAADKTSKTGNVIVMGGKETGKTRLIASLIPAICKELNLPASKVAYVFADQLNEMDITKVIGKLSGGFLVIENANQLTQETVDILDKAMEFRTDGLTVIIEDEKIGMRKLIARFPKFAKKFTSMINIPVFTNDELVNFARVYTKENGYKIDQMGMLALYNLIGINQKEDQPMCIGTVKTMLDKAMERAQSGLFKRSKKRVDRDGYTVLFEKDFS